MFSSVVNATHHPNAFYSPCQWLCVGQHRWNRAERFQPKDKKYDYRLHGKSERVNLALGCSEGHLTLVLHLL